MGMFRRTHSTVTLAVKDPILVGLESDDPDVRAAAFAEWMAAYADEIAVAKSTLPAVEGWRHGPSDQDGLTLFWDGKSWLEGDA